MKRGLNGNKVFKLSCCLVLIFSFGHAQQREGLSDGKEMNRYELWYNDPASNWNEALPIGNGRLGAMVYGGVSTDHVQFNEETLWTGIPQSYAKEGASDHLEHIRQLLFDGKQDEAHEYAQKNFMSDPLVQMAYQPFGDLYMDFKGHEGYTDYKRTLSLNEAIHKVSYKVQETQYNREYFVSKPNELIVVHLSTDKSGALSFDLWLDAAHSEKSVAVQDLSQRLTVKVSDGITAYRSVPYQSALFGEAKVKVDTDGTITENEGKLSVENATTATLYLTAATNYKRYDDVTNDPSNIVETVFDALGAKKYADLKKVHLKDYQQLFNRFDLGFGTTEKDSLPTDERLLQFQSGDPQFVALYVQYGRYLMLSSSREGTNPSNLQGIWNDQMIPAWDSKYTTNINAEMNYWLSEVTSIPETHEPMFKLIEEVAESGAITAKKHYNVDQGWIVHHNTDVWRGTAPINHANHGIFQGGGGWLSHHLWEHYLYSQDIEFLRKRAYPLMKGSAQFYNQVLIKDPSTGWLITSPSNSPETGGLVYGPSMDHQIIRSLFKATIQAASLLEIDSAFSAELAEKLPKIAPDQIGQHGQLQEWVEDKDDITSTHRHVSHLWGVHPGKEINYDDTPELMEAAKVSLGYRGDDGTGWSLAWKINFWARFLEGDHAYELIKMLFRPVTTNETTYGAGGGSYLNLFDAHPPFQIDGNFGAPAGILEMLIQSHMDRIDILPALPTALASGNIRGVKARGGFELAFEWKEGELTLLKIKSLAGKPCKLRYKGKEVELSISSGETVVLDGNLEQH